MGPERGFPAEEFAARTERCQARMAERGVDAILVCTEPEVRYFTGFHTPFWQSPTRPWFTVVPASGKPVAVIPSIGGPSMAATWIDDVRTWSSPQPDDDGVSLLADTIRELAGTSAVVGVPMGPETHVRMPLADVDRLRATLGDFVDVTAIIRGLRMVKSEREIDKHRTICGIVSDAFDRLPEILSTGMTEREAFQAFRAEILRQGADDVPYLVGATGPGGIDDIIRQPSDRLIAAGDLLIFDTGSTFDGYFSDFDRNYAFGDADQGAKDAYRAVWDATEAGLAACRPGATTTDVFHRDERRVAGERLARQRRRADGSRPRHAGHRVALAHRVRRHRDRGAHGADPRTRPRLGAGQSDGARREPRRPRRRPRTPEPPRGP